MDVYGLLGNPVGHSRSPPMHEAAYEALGLDARYVTFEPEPAAFDRAVDGAAALEVTGLNVTVPFKEDALAHPAVAPTPTAARVGAVNTLAFDVDDWHGDGVVDGPTVGDVDATGDNDTGGDEEHVAPVVGDNTDVAGVRRAFAHHDVALTGRDAVVVGAGGAARAAGVALVEAGVESLHVANRTVERAESLASDLKVVAGDVGGETDAYEVAGGAVTDDEADPASTTTVTAHGLDALGALVPSASLLVNATTVGMAAPDETPVPAEHLHGDLAVLDAVYEPIETRLLREATAVGATTVDGAWMLLYQGVVAFEHWTGRDAPVTAMNEALRTRL